MDTSFIRINQAGEEILISTCTEGIADLRETLQCLAYDIQQSTNQCQDSIFLMFNKGKKDVQVHIVLNEQKSFEYEVVTHGFESICDLIQFICNVANNIQTMLQ